MRLTTGGTFKGVESDGLRGGGDRGTMQRNIIPDAKLTLEEDETFGKNGGGGGAVVRHQDGFGDRCHVLRSEEPVRDRSAPSRADGPQGLCDAREDHRWGVLSSNSHSERE